LRWDNAIIKTGIVVILEGTKEADSQLLLHPRIREDELQLWVVLKDGLGEILVNQGKEEGIGVGQVDYRTEWEKREYVMDEEGIGNTVN